MSELRIKYLLDSFELLTVVTDWNWLLSNLKLISIPLSLLTDKPAEYLNYMNILSLDRWSDGAMERDKHQQVSWAGEKSLILFVMIISIYNFSEKTLKHSPAPSHHHHQYH